MLEKCSRPARGLYGFRGWTIKKTLCEVTGRKQWAAADPGGLELLAPTRRKAKLMVMKTDYRVQLITDGSCFLKKGGAGGWAALLKCKGKERVFSGGELGTTNNRMELMAVIGGLEALKYACHVTVTTDSKYVMHAFTQNWLRGWQRNGWVTSNEQPVKNKDLWLRLLELSKLHQVEWKWVKGHNGHPDNERVDDISRKQALSQIQASKRLPAGLMGYG